MEKIDIVRSMKVIAIALITITAMICYSALSIHGVKMTYDISWIIAAAIIGITWWS